MSDTFSREIDLPAPPEHVWAAIASADGLAGWLADAVELDPVPGGEAVFREGETVRRGWVEEVLPPRRLAFWWSEDEGPASRVELTLVPLGVSATRLRIEEARPLDRLELIGTPLPGAGGERSGPALLAGCR